MKLAPIPDYDSNIDEPDERWSLSWNPEERCDEFTREAILARAPADSGVYGLFNFDCQIFIGESANVRDVLLRLERETDFGSQRLRPSGFTFELCPEESRKRRASELIARHRPVLQTIASSNELIAPATAVPTEAAQAGRSTVKTDAEDHEFLSHDENATRERRFFKGAPAMVLAAALIAGAASYYFATLSDKVSVSAFNVNARSSAGIPEQSPALVSQPASDSKTMEPSPGKSSPESGRLNDEPMPGKASAALRLANASGTEEAEVRKVSAPAQPSRPREPVEKQWSVQISAVPAKDVADRLAQELIAKGYAGYVVQAEVKGQAYYRVRAGRFAGREEAESAREALTQRDGYRDAYVTSD
jgi:cell division septation protein DedD